MALKLTDMTLAPNRAAATVRGDVSGRTLLRAMGGICEMRATGGWQQEPSRSPRSFSTAYATARRRRSEPALPTSD